MAEAFAVPGQLTAAENYALGQGLFCRYVRHRVRKQLKQDGFALIGKTNKPLTDAQIDDLFEQAQVSDTVIMGHARQSGAIGDGKFLEWLGKIVDWIADHQEQILAIIKFIMALLAIFAI